MDGQEKCRGMKPRVCCSDEKTVSPSVKISRGDEKLVSEKENCFGRTCPKLDLDTMDW